MDWIPEESPAAGPEGPVGQKSDKRKNFKAEHCYVQIRLELTLLSRVRPDFARRSREQEVQETASSRQDNAIGPDHGREEEANIHLSWVGSGQQAVRRQVKARG